MGRDLTLRVRPARADDHQAKLAETAKAGQEGTKIASIGGPGGVKDAEVTANAPYTLSESGTGLDAYAPVGSWACTGTGSFSQLENHPDVVTLQPGANVTCTITNATAAVQFDKTVVNVHGGTAQASDFTITLTAEGADPVSVPIKHDGTTDKVFIKPGTAYVIGETGPDGYSMAVTCVDAADQPVDLVHHAITLPASPDAHVAPVTCHVTNTYQAVSLTLSKEVSGGPATAGAWTLTLDPTALGADEKAVGHLPITQNHDQPTLGSTDTVWVVPGQTYTIGEVASGDVVVSGYKLTGVKCLVGDDPNLVPATVGDDGKVHLTVPARSHLGADAHIACTLTNTNQAVQLTATKHVDGGPAAASAWALTLEPQGVGPDGKLLHWLPITEVAHDPATGSAGPVWVMPNQTYTLTESPADGTSVPNYALTAATCTVGDVTVQTTLLPHGKVQVIVPPHLGTDHHIHCDLTNTYTAPKGQLTLTKTVTSGPLTAADWTLTAQQGTNHPLAWLGDPQATNHQGVAQPVEPGLVYTLNELSVKTGQADYVAQGWSCSRLDPASSTWVALTASTDPLVDHPAGQSNFTVDGHVQVAAGDQVQCSVTNATATVQLTKVVANDAGGVTEAAAWRLALMPTTATEATWRDLTPATGFAASTLPFTVKPGVAYTLIEDAAPGQGAKTSGYAVVGMSCTASDGAALPTVTKADHTVVAPEHHAVAVADGDTVVFAANPNPHAVVTCTITNGDTAPKLRLAKSWLGEPATPDNKVELKATPRTKPAGTDPKPLDETVTVLQGAATTTTIDAVAGVIYDLAEPTRSGAPSAQYGAWSCKDAKGGDVTMSSSTTGGPADQVTLRLGQEVTCTVTNVTAQVEINKTVVNRHGGTAEPKDWAFTLTPVDADGVALPGATPLPLGIDAAHQGAVDAATGSQSGLSGAVAIQPGQRYRLDEKAADGVTASKVAGYAASGSITCQAGDVKVNVNAATSGSFIELPVDTAGKLGAALATPIRCQLTNEDQAAQLTLVKKVNGPLKPSSWTLTAEPTSGVTLAWDDQKIANHAAQGTMQEVQAGMLYKLAESSTTPGAENYVGKTWVCTAADAKTTLYTVGVHPDIPAGASVFDPAAGTVRVALGEQVSCEITNATAVIQLHKTVVNDNGGKANETQFELILTDPVTKVATTWPVLGNGWTSAFVLKPGVAYQVTEQAVPAPPSGNATGYALVVKSCTGGVVIGDDHRTITLPAGTTDPVQTVSCEIENNDIAPTLTLHKTWPGAPDGATVELTATPHEANPHAKAVSATLTIKDGEAETTPLELFAGVGYDLAEHVTSETPYTAVGAWSCTATDSDGHEVTLASPNDRITPAVGQQIDCTQTNVTAKVQFDKTVVNDDDGEAAPDAWNFSLVPVDKHNQPIQNAQPIPVGVPTHTAAAAAWTTPVAFVQAGQRYQVVETGAPGYTGSEVKCSVKWNGVTLNMNQTSDPLYLDVPVPGNGLVAMVFDNVISCAITNDDPAVPLLTLTKSWPGGDLGEIPANALGTTLSATPVAVGTPLTGGSLVDDGFSANGSDVQGLKALSQHRLTAGQTYKLAESPTTTDVPFAPAGWNCVDGHGVTLPLTGDGTKATFDPATDLLTVALGAKVTCTAVNQTAAVSMSKIVPNGPAKATDWAITLTPIGTGPTAPDGAKSVVRPQSVTGSSVVQLVPGVSYTVTEKAVGNVPAGYPTMGQLACSADSKVTVKDNVLTVAAGAKGSGEIGSCWLTNAYTAPNEPTPTPTPWPKPKPKVPGALATTGAPVSVLQTAGGTALVATGLIAIGLSLLLGRRRQTDSQ